MSRRIEGWRQGAAVGLCAFGIAMTGPGAGAEVREELRLHTDGLLQAGGQYHRIPAGQRPKALERMRATAERRKAMLLQDASADPERFLRHALPKEARQRLPRPVHSLVEEEVELEGEVTALQVDDFTGHGELIYQLRSAQTGDKRLRLRFAKGEAPWLTGARIKVRGVALGSELVVAEAGGSSAQTIAAAPTMISGDQRTIVMLINFTNDTQQPWSPASVHDAMFNAASSVNRFYQDVSFGNLSLSGDVVGWFTIPLDNSGCNYNGWANAADSAATAAGVSLGNYQRRVYLFPRTGSCGWAGLGTIGGNPSRAWSNGYNDYRLFAHELGHNLGAHHASTLSCGGSAIGASGACTTSEYGDAFDVMGFWNLFQWNGPHKVGAGWLSGSRVQTVTGGGLFTLTPLELDQNTPQVLKINRPNTSEAYYVAYRQPLGMDGGLPSGMTQGVSVHVWSANAAAVQTKLLDTSPGDGFQNAALSDGGTFNDAANNITVKQLSHGGSAATVEVSFGSAPCTRATPSVNLTPISQAGSPGETVSYAVSITNHDGSNCNSGVFALTPVLPNGWSGTLSVSSFSLAPGATGTSTWDVASAAGTTDGSYPLSLQVGDGAMVEHTAAVAATYVVMTDGTPPTVTITHPKPGARVERRPQINVTAIDESGIARVDMLIDGVVIFSDAKPPFRHRVSKLDRLERGRQVVISAKAIDNAGNEAIASVTVTVK
ncbi:MAG: hypothetical protein COV75_05285 [Candidatus Omnitrophica bacterium CG11_big_fil_rev_8_21_14_0_20_63_9]|nr:MAG: hypothetical protein COV75_05285 [Candidatus Omnitrophica bacterium CG11_big_fil_rev_8_21_14_0_20_63_9]